MSPNATRLPSVRSNLAENLDSIAKTLAATEFDSVGGAKFEFDHERSDRDRLVFEYNSFHRRQPTPPPFTPSVTSDAPHEGESAGAISWTIEEDNVGGTSREDSGSGTGSSLSYASDFGHMEFVISTGCIDSACISTTLSSVIHSSDSKADNSCSRTPGSNTPTETSSTTSTLPSTFLVRLGKKRIPTER
ncbi:uncharacterized protein C8R40DRAFT_1166012 [Lentinula edodes]|uniref:uncharacterized protein n=1 Tax=Lentinula edodes TaxID=5353 RepID=UPI001E8DBA52|nr:uncharacterized protein C8R40DRAFT_1170898 [Lentinula edodes]XP_046090868.1 uncharacterized protein C8R40DRAFT_1166012 [Lentinula edodes]KAH7875289.1 hypothetical protein C8R40DRAFT_1170898 [Lentinula edodes]KAH7879774.1 hypothetical protein C8R40DRAFT_1166012 [Lentinula edodes]